MRLRLAVRVEGRRMRVGMVVKGRASGGIGWLKMLWRGANGFMVVRRECTGVIGLLRRLRIGHSEGWDEFRGEDIEATCSESATGDITVGEA